MSKVAATEAAVSGTCVQVVEGWSLVVVEGGEPTVLDLDLGARLGFARPRKFRDLVARMIRDGILKDSDHRPTVGRCSIGSGATREVTEYHLTRKGALLAIAKSRTPKANEITRQMVDVFDAYLRGTTPSVAPAAPQAPRVAEVDRVLLRLDALSRAAARAALLPAAPRHGSVLAALGRLLADAHTVACDVDAVDARHYLEEASHALVVQLRIWRREEAARAVRLAARAAK